MPRQGKGGRRSGKSGAQYANRSDLAQAPRVATGQPYGQAQMQREAQQAQPLPQSRVAAAPAQRPPAGGGPLPGSLTPLSAPTARPNEPLTTGLPMGAGPGPEVLGGVPNDPVDVLRGMLQEDPDNDALRALVSLADQGY